MVKILILITRASTISKKGADLSRNTIPEFSKGQVNRAGNNIRNGIATDTDIKIIENWRAAHNKILNDWQAALRGRCKSIDVIFAQRLKRRSTIFDKLNREPEMELARMHDIAGCRLIFNDINSLNEYRSKLHKSWMKHVRRKANETPYPYDYIARPHPDKSGYRGIHDVYQYCARPGRAQQWNNLQVEIQYRTKAQHAWATANEIAGSMTGNQSKFGRGDKRQKEFFRLASEIIARTHEGMSSCYPNLTDKELFRAFIQIEKEIKLLRKLKNLKIAAEKLDLIKQNVILVHSESDKTLQVYSFSTLPTAQMVYFRLEKEHGTSKDIVLVRAPNKENIRQAYKNYFSDTKDFTKLIENGLQKLAKSKK